MSAISVDYTNIVLTDDGADFASAVKDEIQATGVDLALRPVNTGAETISGAWTFTATATFSASVNTTFCMGDQTTPVGTYATAVSATNGMSLANTQTEIDKIRSALIAAGLIK